jgi:acetyltransferase-like isoleucine patch superfamily enzyme
MEFARLRLLDTLSSLLYILTDRRTERRNQLMFESEKFFDLDGVEHKAAFPANEPVWAALDGLEDYLSGLFGKPRPLSNISGQIEKTIVIHGGEVRHDLDVTTSGPKNSVQVYSKGELIEDASVIMPGAYLFDDKVILGSGVIVEPGALLKGPVVIGNSAEIRQGAYVRGNCIIGDRCVVGHTTEIKGSIMLDGAQAGHFAYIGDSILGKDVNLGAGTKLANLRIIPGTVKVPFENERHDTGRRKMGAVLGDGTQTGCNSVTSPGTLVGPGSSIYPGVVVPAGYHPGRTTFRPPKDAVRIHVHPDESAQ